MSKLFLLSAQYNGKALKTNLIFYNPQTNKLVTIADPFNHKPYCYVKPEYKSQLDVIVNSDSKYSTKEVMLTDSISDTRVGMIKVSAPDPLSIGGSETSLRNKIVTWESDIKYYERYLFDNQLVCGEWYEVDGTTITPYNYEVNLDEVKQRLELGDDKIYNEFVTYWVGLLNQPIPEIKRVAVDIEVEYDGDKIPNVVNANKKITAIGFASSDGVRKVYTLDQASHYKSTSEVIYYSSERQLIIDAFKFMMEYPVIVTFNGDAFDLPYLYARCEKLVIPYKDVPLTVKSTKVANGAYVDPVYIKGAIHLDLYRFFKNRSIQNYAFSHKYAEFGLDAISKGILDEAKITYEGSLNDLTPDKLAEYCLNDADLTVKLTTFNNNLLIKLMVMICRISKQPLDDICRYGINQWGRGMFYSEQIKRKILIPRSDELLSKGFTASMDATIKDKKYKGAYVFKPEKGVYFNVFVLDFASLYPSIVKVYNLSYETVNCPHQQCMSNHVPETNSWVCKKKQGLASLIIGSLRDLRVSYYKYMSKKDGLTDDEHQLYDIVAQTLKVILNASYGIMGFESFPLYCLPVAESVTSYGRNIITQTIKKSSEMGIKTIYGDTDSIFVHNPQDSKLEQIIKWTSSNFGIDLEVDKHYRYLVLTDLKKNYLGVTDKGKPDVKGLTGKKSHTPVFIRELFFNVLDILCKVKDEDDFKIARQHVIDEIREEMERLKNNKLSFDQLAYNVVINKDIDSYGRKVSSNKLTNLDGNQVTVEEYKSLPQHIKAAKLLPNAEVGSIVSIIKTRGEPSSKPKTLIKSINEVDTDKYVELMGNTFEQILDSFNISFHELTTGTKQTTLDDLLTNGRLL